MNPYQTLPSEAFWKLAVAEREISDVADLWAPRFEIAPTDAVVTFGSCFAQHIGRALKKRGYKWLCTERRPDGLTDANAHRYNYEVFSARTGNIYTTTLLLQWTEWALGKRKVPDEIWRKDARCFDPFRPRIEPEGFKSPMELVRSRDAALTSFRRAIKRCNVFVFTLGLTESWRHRKRRYEYPMCPGTAAGEFDAELHQFVNQPFDQIRKSLIRAFKLMRRTNSKIRFLLTVSPVPLTATNSGRHVIVATMASKSILRAVADAMVSEFEDIDYFPSYEIINSPVFKGAFFNPNQRTVSKEGVNFVMDNFFHCQASTFGSSTVPAVAPHADTFAEEVCEEELLEAFGGNLYGQ